MVDGWWYCGGSMVEEVKGGNGSGGCAIGIGRWRDCGGGSKGCTGDSGSSNGGGIGSGGGWTQIGGYSM